MANVKVLIKEATGRRGNEQHGTGSLRAALHGACGRSRGRRGRRTDELRRANKDLEDFNSIAVGRELRMIEMKKTINELCIQSGQPPPYQLTFNQGAP